MPSESYLGRNQDGAQAESRLLDCQISGLISLYGASPSSCEINAEAKKKEGKEVAVLFTAHMHKICLLCGDSWVCLKLLPWGDTAFQEAKAYQLVKISALSHHFGNTASSLRYRRRRHETDAKCLCQPAADDGIHLR